MQASPPSGSDQEADIVEEAFEHALSVRNYGGPTGALRNLAEWEVSFACQFCMLLSQNDI